MDVRPLIARGINWERLVPELDEVGDQVRLATIRELGQDHLARLFDGAPEHETLPLDELVPLASGSSPVAHDGHHPGVLFPKFATHFVRRAAEDGEPELIGYHERAGLHLGGPAYFTVLRADDGSISLDGTRTPQHPPLGWPAAASPPSRYRGRVDVLRRVSGTVTVGHAQHASNAARDRVDRPHAGYFALVRRTGRF